MTPTGKAPSWCLERVIRVTEQGNVLYRAEKQACRRFHGPASPDLFNGVAPNFRVFDPLELIAELTQHVPEPNKHLARYFGWVESFTERHIHLMPRRR